MMVFQVSMSGMDVEWQRLRVISENLANMNSTRDALGRTYTPQRLVSGQAVNFEAMLAGLPGAEASAIGTQVMRLEDMAEPFRNVFEPNHPHADANGFVAYPNVDHATEMALMLKTSRIYEANLTAFTIGQQMYSRALEMGR